jgi:tRNA(His) 5'-end guanylyltransferase
MKKFEAYKDNVVLPDMYIMVRLDGVGFSRLTKELGIEKPFSKFFSDCMVQTVKTLMEEVPEIAYGYTQSDEITLVFQRDTQYFGRRPEKIATVLAGKASSILRFELEHSLYVHLHPSFDARVIVMPTRQHVQENLHWRIEDSVKNCRNLLVFWGLVMGGATHSEATSRMQNKAVGWQNDYLFVHHAINFNEVAGWKKRGSILYRKKTVVQGYNPMLKKATKAIRSIIHIDQEIPDVRLAPILDYLDSTD